MTAAIFSKDSICACFILDYMFLDLRLISTVRRAEEGKVGVLGPHTCYFYSTNFLEASVKSTHVEPEAGTVIVSCDGAVKKGSEKESREV